MWRHSKVPYISDYKHAADNSDDDSPLVSAYCVPSSSPALNQRISTVDLVGAGYSAGSWGAKHEQSSDHHTEQTRYWGKDDKEVSTQTPVIKVRASWDIYRVGSKEGVLRVGW